MRNQRLHSTLLLGFPVLLIAGGGLTACSRSGKAESKRDAAPVTVPIVAVARAERTTLMRQEVLAADFHPFQIVDVHAKVAGYLKKIYVDVGDHVKEGQTLAVLEIPELTDEMTRAKAAKSRSSAEVDRAQEELLRAQSQHDAVHLVYDRLRKVAETRPNLIAQQEIDDARARDQTAEAGVSAAKAAVASSKQGVDVSQADVEKTQSMNAYTKITAPFAGVITKRYADTGAMVPAGTSSGTNSALVQLSQNTLLRLILPVPESIVARIKLGQTVDVRVDALKRTFMGRITRFASEVDRSTRTMDTQVDVPNPSLLLIPGMYAEAIITLDRKDNALAIPLEGVNMRSTSSTAYVVGPDNKIQMRILKLGLETPDRVEVLEGLNPGDLVVTGNRAQLTEGQAIKPQIVDWQSSKPPAKPGSKPE